MPASQRMLPQNVEAELSVLGAIMIKNDAMTQVQDKLRSEDFYRESHRIVYDTMNELVRDSKPIDLLTLEEALRKKGVLEKIGGVGFLTQVANYVPTAANIVYHANIVKEKSELRHLIDAATIIAGNAYEGTEDVQDIMDDAEKRIFAVTNEQSADDMDSVDKIVVQTIAHVEKLYENKGGITGLATGFRDFDKLTSGLQKSDLVLVAARPSMGKTAFTLNIAAYAALHGHTVAFFSLEMNKEQLVQRMLCSEGQIDSQRLRTGQIDAEDWGRLIDTSDRISRAKLFIDSTPGIGVMELRSKARRLKAKEGSLDLIVIDYLQLMQGRASKSNDASRQQEISEISRSLKALARELDVPVVALSQLSREVEKRPGKKPMLSDLRESGSLEQDADIVMFLFREDYYNKETENKNITELIIAKHRNGPIGTVELFFQKEYTKFQDLIRTEA
ncbi:replicative DNA helicase [Selenomonas sp.]|uniref:replicative DNA helicase n=2 Tax=Selenomonas sp. TaxID=2053611 RepID=UPI002A753EAD|nr:replicative DNA helicase [Selenomonas sp.]MDY3298277.1 replicative DNA helicase [Selenomonas sp.]MDY4416684.1 replicative DNA helicase [Selenomonas sp.]